MQRISAVTGDENLLSTFDNSSEKSRAATYLSFHGHKEARGSQGLTTNLHGDALTHFNGVWFGAFAGRDKRG